MIEPIIQLLNVLMIDSKYIKSNCQSIYQRLCQNLLEIISNSLHKTKTTSLMFYVQFVVGLIRVACGRSSSISQVLGGSFCVLF